MAKRALDVPFTRVVLNAAAILLFAVFVLVFRVPFTAAQPALPSVPSEHNPVTNQRPTEPRIAPGKIIVGVQRGFPLEEVLKSLPEISARVIRVEPLTDSTVLSVPPGSEMSAIVKLRQDPHIRYAEPDYIRHLDQISPPNDPQFVNQWNLNNIQALSGWGVYPNCTNCQGNFANGPLIAVVDSGIDLTNPDLIAHGTGDPDVYGHGTHVIGIISAALNDAFGTVGLAFNSKVASYRACDSTGNCADSDVINSINAAVVLGAKVINMSFGSSDSSTALCDAVRSALGAGVSMVASAGNNGVIGLNYPAACSGVIAVAATDQNDNPASFSNGDSGESILVAAPGVNIISTLPTNPALTFNSPTGFGMLSGTSMAAPHVAGLVGLIRGLNPSLGPQQIAVLLAKNADKVGGPYRFNFDDICAPQGSCSWNNRMGYGRINVSRTLCNIANDKPQIQAVTPGAGPVGGGTSVTVIGTCFANVTAVRFGNAPAPSASLVVNSPSQLTVNSPPSDTGGLVDVVVWTSTGISNVTPKDRFAYGPVITGLTPKVGPVAGTVVTVLGQGFANRTNFQFGSGQATNVNCSSDTSCIMNGPPHPPGVVDVIASVGGAQSSPNQFDRFTYTGPEITRIDPTTGSNTGSYVNLYGSGFLPGNTMSVLFGTTPSQYVFCSNEVSCQAYSPPGEGTVDIVVSVDGTTSAITPADRFTYIDQPKIISVNPSIGLATGGERVTVLGSNFALGSGTQVSFGTAVAADTNCQNTTSCLVTAPAGAGMVDVRAIVAGVSSNITPNGTYGYVPVVSSIEPNTGPANGGTQVTVSGAGFSTGQTFGPSPIISFGGHPTTDGAICSADSCRVTSPPGSGAADVQVSLASLLSTSTPQDVFTYQPVQLGAGWSAWATPFHPRLPGLVAYDADRNSIVMANGSETWTWSVSGGWSQASPQHMPFDDGTAMVYDAATKRALMFGGVATTPSGRINIYAITWTWDGSDWTRQQPAVSPPARWGESMVFDPRSGKVLMFGGCTDVACKQKLDDMWEWDGQTWAQISPPNKPSARSGAVLVDLPNATQILLFGGSDSRGFRNETWIWNGNTWGQLAPSSSPDLESMLVLARDPKNGGAILFGGPAGSSSATETWRWDGTTWSHLTPNTHPDVFPIGFTFDNQLAADMLIGASGEIWSWAGQ